MSHSLLLEARRLLNEKQYEKAIYCFQELLVHESAIASHYLELSSCLTMIGHLDESIVVVKQGMVYADENFMNICQQQLANIYLAQQRYELAAPLFEQGITRIPLDLNPYLGLSNVYLKTHQPSKAISVLQASPNELKNHHAYVLNLTLAMFQVRDVDGALETILEHWETQSVDKDLLSNAMMFASYTSRHQEFLGQIAPYLNSYYSVNPINQLKKYNHPRLRVGFVSGDFGMHPVGYFLQSFLSELNQLVDVYLYSNDGQVDRLTSQIQKKCFKFCLIDQFNSEVAKHQIINDEIDILIDLSGHTAKNRLDIFHQRAATYQLTYLGFPESTGLSQIDGQITDSSHVRESEIGLYAEKIWHLPSSRFCFLPAINLPKISDAPLLANRYMTFGNFGNPSKISSSCAEIWGQALLAFPNARLKLKHQLWNDFMLKKSVLKIWTDMGIEPGRIEFYGTSQYDVYLESFAEIDFILDSYPFAGGTTTCEALWMGVPVLTIPGSFPASRQGVSILEAVGEDRWIVANVMELIECLQGVDNNPSSLLDFRKNIRTKINSSTLGDGERFARDFHKVLNMIQSQVDLI